MQSDLKTDNSIQRYGNKLHSNSLQHILGIQNIYVWDIYNGPTVYVLMILIKTVQEFLLSHIFLCKAASALYMYQDHDLCKNSLF